MVEKWKIVEIYVIAWFSSNMFDGSYFHSIDEKGRVGIPKQFREILPEYGEPDILIVTLGYEGCLAAYPTNIWKEIVENKIHKLSKTDKFAQRFRRFFIAQKATCKIDKLGRISLPLNLREYAGIKKDVVVSGVGDEIEIWSKERWDEYWTNFRNNEDEFIEERRNHEV